MTVFAGVWGEFFRRVFTGYEWSEGSSEHIGCNLAMSVSTFSDDL
ncbi:hypothetical protein MCC93_11470 [Morococcus cerebrosus]|uniref:Uncharacterized protein n=1 Tax=Morococcus cerebrosus TaxID=1056807 RepID=A0A0C1GQK1_9NEIS|nr:hypothetical protein MCC93_11470 [Morococcus cerebrosus]